MKRSKLAMLIFMALCCGMGMFGKRIINPFANIVTDNLHIPGGISTGFSLMFLVIPAELTRYRWGGLLMGAVQGGLAVMTGRVGSMGALMPIGYMTPGLAIDLVYRLASGLPREERMVLANAAAAVTASLTANVIVFRLHGAVLCLYLAVSAVSGSLWGLLGSCIAGRLGSIVGKR